MSRPTTTLGLIKHIAKQRWQQTSGLTKVALLIGVFAVASALTMRLACGACGACCARQVEGPAMTEVPATPDELRLPEDTQRPHD